MEEKDRRHVTLVLSRELYERLTEIRWQRRATSFGGMLRGMLRESAERYENENGEPAETVGAHK